MELESPAALWFLMHFLMFLEYFKHIQVIYYHVAKKLKVLWWLSETNQVMGQWVTWQQAAEATEEKSEREKAGGQRQMLIAWVPSRRQRHLRLSPPWVTHIGVEGSAGVRKCDVCGRVRSCKLPWRGTIKAVIAGQVLSLFDELSGTKPRKGLNP